VLQLLVRLSVTLLVLLKKMNYLILINLYSYSYTYSYTNTITNSIRITISITISITV